MKFRINLKWKLVLIVSFLAILPVVALAIRHWNNIEKVDIIIIAGSFILFFLPFYFIADLLTSNMSKARSFAQAIAKGNLDIEPLEVKKNSEAGRMFKALNQMRERLYNDIRKMKLDILNAVEELLVYSEELSASAEEANVTIETTNQSIESMTASIQQISVNSQEVNDFAQKANLQAQAGSEKIEELTNVREIKQVTSNAVEAINKLNLNSQEIDKIVELITNIAEQTNLLALNAAIEAARAGDYGRGFAVVAEEIRELAEETTKAITEIGDLINDIQFKSKAGLEAVNKLDNSIQARTKTVQSTDEVFLEIKNSIEDTSIHLQQTTNITEELAVNSEQVITASQEIDDMSDEVNNSSQKLANMAQKLKKLVEKFDL